MRTLTATLLLFLLFVAACNKDEFPDEFSIIGAWIEQTPDTSKVEIEFRSGNRVFLMKDSRLSIDTLRYKLDKTDELQLFLPEEFPDGKRTYHKLGYSQKKKELTIYQLFPTLPAEPDEMVFKRK